MRRGRVRSKRLELDQENDSDQDNDRKFVEPAIPDMAMDVAVLAEIEQQLTTAFERWAELEARTAALKTNGPA